MRNNKNKWSFYRLISKPPLEAEEVAYWKTSLGKILKVGMEFEFNLPEKKTGTCKGDSPTCPCSKLMLEETCWQECLHKDNCATSRKSVSLCSNATDLCVNEDCKSCSLFKFKCNSIYCPNFISKCFMCNEVVRSCESCDFRFDPNLSPDTIRKKLTEELRPNNTYGIVNDSGVHSITTDGSLLGKKGAEIITVGRRVDYWEFYKMSKRIIDSATSRGAYINERCSLHMHLLASYYNKILRGSDNSDDGGVPNRVSEMEKDMPEIILSNIHQLVRRYQNAMTWMTMGLDEPERMTRWEKFRVSVLNSSAVLSPMYEVAEDVSKHAGGNKYSWVNYKLIEFTQTGSIKRFHIEMRGADGILCPSAVAAIACMYYAIVIKAVEISRYGVVEVGDKEWLARATEIKAAMMNNMKGYNEEDRFSNTKNLYKYQDTLISESLDLVGQLKSILIKIGPAYEVLEKLAEAPIAIRRCSGHTIPRIEKDLEVILNAEDKMAISVGEIITLNQVSECSSMEEWINTVCSILGKDSETHKNFDQTHVRKSVSEFVENKGNAGELVWSNRIGAPILI